MILKFDIQESIKGIWEKLGGWLDTLILNLPNFFIGDNRIYRLYFYSPIRR